MTRSFAIGFLLGAILGYWLFLDIEVRGLDSGNIDYEPVWGV